MTARILKLILMVAFLQVALGGPLSAANTIKVVKAAALDGTVFGLRARFTGSNGNTFVIDRSPNAEPTYCFRVRVNPLNVMVPNGKRVEFLKAQGANLKTLLSAGIRRSAAGKLSGWIKVKQASGSRGFFIPLKKGDRLLEVWWSTATAPGADDGTLLVMVDGVVKHDVSNLTRVDVVNNVKLGALRGNTDLANIPGGRYFVDEFASFRTLAP